VRRLLGSSVALVAGLPAFFAVAQNVASPAATLVSKDNRVEVASAGGGWSAGSAGQTLNFGDRLKTGEDSRAVVRMADGSVLQLDELTTIELKQPASGAGATLSMPAGAGFFYSRTGSRETRIETPSANGAIRGTAFLLEVDRATGGTVVSMMAGLFDLSGGGDSVAARQGEQARAGAEGASLIVYGDTGDTAPWYLVIENKLPVVQPLQEAGKHQFLSALSGALREYMQVSPQLSGRAAMVRPEWARDVLRTAFDVVKDCPLRARILRSIIAAVPHDAAGLTELAMQYAPECAAAFQNILAGGPAREEDFVDPPGLRDAPPNWFTGPGSAEQGNVVAICHNGRTIFVSPAGAQNHLNNHLGDTLGACQVTPLQNR
jgi:hypothetical protein